VNIAETELVERLKKGDPEAFDMLYDIYAGRLYAFSMKYLKSPEDSEELVQSVFMKVWENRKRLERDLSFKSFLFTIAYNEICRLFRRKSYLRKYIEESMHTVSSSDNSVEESAGFHSLLEEVEKIVTDLPERQRKAFIMCKIDGKPSKEVAADLGLSPGTVDNYVSATVKMIRSRLSGESFACLLFVSLFLI
jgi:RNA polymerase sigma-70 factor (ECF subfamily)